MALRRWRPPSLPWPIAALHLAGLAAFGLGKPVLDLLTADALLGWECRGTDALILAIAVLAIPPVVLLAVQLAAGLMSSVARGWVHLASIACLCYLIGAFALRYRTPERPVLTAACVVLAVAAAGVYARFAGVRAFATVLAVSPVLFLGLFVFDSSASRVIFPAEVAAADVRARPVPVILVVFDELPATSLLTADRQIDAARFPAFASFARDATWYRNATTPFDHTREAIPAIATGRRTRRGTVAVADDHRESLFTLLGRSHRLQVSEPVTRICPRNLCDQSTPRALASRLGSLTRELGAIYGRHVLPRRVAERLPERRYVPDPDPDPWVRRFLRGLAAPNPNRFAFLHLEIPHAPWVYLPSGRRYRPPADGQLPLPHPWLPLQTRQALLQAQLQRHLAQIGYTDRVLDRILDGLRRSGEYDRSLVIVAADHGIVLHPGELPARSPSPGRAAHVQSVPLIVKAPFQDRGRIDDRWATTLDIAPTIAAHTGARAPWRFDGRPLGGPPAPPPPTLSLYLSGLGSMSIRPGEFLRQRNENARYVGEAFGRGPIADALLESGPRRDLVGASVTDLGARSSPGPAAHLDDPEQFGAVDLRARVPAFVTGTVTGPGARAGQALAIALGDRVVTTARTYDAGSGVRFAVFTGDRWLRPGRNRVSVLAVSERGKPGPAIRLGGT
jgi:hypothetical protein